jgi:5-methylcytosine-specific restriction endonuclease McrA
MKSQIIKCKHCEKEHFVQNKYSSKSLYCSVQCQQDLRLMEKVKSGLASSKTMKRYLLREYGHKCWSCGITNWNNKPIIMELEHIDGNSENNSLDNLSILCPNCHSQTPTYKAKNVGKGRHSRRIRYAEGKSY